jgi:hypothetical protein
MITPRVNSFTGFQSLKEVWLGDCYPEHFYNHLPNSVQDAFGIITEWTKADLFKIQQVLESFNIKVQRPTFTDSIDDYVYNDQLLKPPITPRDDSMTFGNIFYHLRSKYKIDPWSNQINDFLNHGVTVNFGNAGPLDCVYPPSIVRVGKDIYVDIDTHKEIWGYISETVIDWAKHYRVHICQTDGHSDGVFCPVAPGIIVATQYLSQYQQTFPNWEVFHLPKLKNNGTFGHWHVGDSRISNNNGFKDHINKYALDWVGNFTETVFEANMLVIDQHHVLAIKEDKGLTAWLKQRGIEVIYCDFRCRGFWDGGLHCLTTDIVREGNCDNYFPMRPDINYLDWLS